MEGSHSSHSSSGCWLWASAVPAATQRQRGASPLSSVLLQSRFYLLGGDCVLCVGGVSPVSVCGLYVRYIEASLPLALGPHKILPIFLLCNKGGRGENILRNIVGNKGGLGGEYCTIMCNNAPFPVSRTIFFQTPPPSKTRPIKANSK